MLIETVCSVAFYCQRCGKIHIQRVPYFCGRQKIVFRCSSCSHEQAIIFYGQGRRLSISVECGVCKEINTFTYDMASLNNLQFEKLYCQHDHFELGYIGRLKKITEFLDFNQAEYEAMHPGEEKNLIEKQQMLLEAVNRVHDCASAGYLQCPCGSRNIIVDIIDDSIVLECAHCGSYCILSVRNQDELKKLKPGMEFDFILPDMVKKR